MCRVCSSPAPCSSLKPPPHPKEATKPLTVRSNSHTTTLHLLPCCPCIIPRRDLLGSDFKPPATWQALLAWAAAVNGTIDVDGDGHTDYALCLDRAAGACMHHHECLTSSQSMERYGDPLRRMQSTYQV